jgi:hypothetical protein
MQSVQAALNDGKIDEATARQVLEANGFKKKGK